MGNNNNKWTMIAIMVVFMLFFIYKGFTFYIEREDHVKELEGRANFLKGCIMDDNCINIVRKSKPWNKELRKLEEK